MSGDGIEPALAYTHDRRRVIEVMVISNEWEVGEVMDNGDIRPMLGGFETLPAAKRAAREHAKTGKRLCVYSTRYEYRSE